MQKRCGEDQVCGVLRFQAGLACRISRGVSGLRQHAWQGEKGQRSLTEQAACTRSCPREAAKRQSKPCSLSRWGAGKQALRLPRCHRDWKERRSPPRGATLRTQTLPGSGNTGRCRDSCEVLETNIY